MYPHYAQTELLAPTGSYVMGTSVAVAPELAVVGDPYQADGAVAGAGGVAVYVTPSPSARYFSFGLGTLTSVSPPNPQVNAGFGTSVATDGNTVVVGAPDATESGQSDAGAVYVYQRPTGGWRDLTTPVATITAPTPEPADHFGTSVAVQGDTVVVGAPGADDGAGGVLVFTKPITGWTGSAPGYAGLGNGLSGAISLGTSVAIDGDVIAAGAPDTEVSAGDAGAVDLYVEPNSGEWLSTDTPSRILVESDPQIDQVLGASVAMYGQYVIGGAPANLGTQLGRVDVFTLPAGGWAGGELDQSAQLTDSAAPNASQFGLQVAIDGSQIVAGAPEQTSGGKKNAGAVDVFRPSKTGYATTSTPSARVTGSAPQVGGLFGAAVADDGSQVLVGAPGVLDHGTTTKPRGSAYLFTPLPVPTLTAVSQSKKAWKEGSKQPSVDPKKAPKGGTAFGLTVNQQMWVDLEFQRHSHGHYLKPRDLEEFVVKGKNVIYFDGRMHPSTKLATGKYRVVIQAFNPAYDVTAKHTLHFTIK
jgi:FG-GAP repeat